jgi:sulfite reductase beta subunit-like hemoprotein
MGGRGCAQSLREGLKVVLKDWLMSKLILASCLGSFCNGGLLVAMVLFYSLAIEVRTSSHPPTLSPSLTLCGCVRACVRC